MADRLISLKTVWPENEEANAFHLAINPFVTGAQYGTQLGPLYTKVADLETLAWRIIADVGSN